MQEGRVLHAHSGRYAVLDAAGRVVACRARRALRRPAPDWPEFPVPGDVVEWTPVEPAGGVIEAVHPRRSEIARSRAGTQHVVVANLDQLVVVVSVCTPEIDRGLLDRLLCTAERSRIPARICLHKVDLAPASAREGVRAVYERAGYPVLYSSAVTGEGVDALRAALHGHVSAFMGSSGAGKSRLISRLQPGLVIRTGMVSERTGQGRHTTTRVDLHPTEFGALLADTPGVREFSLWGLPPEQLRDLFPEFREIQEACHFAGCSHDHEPECAVKAAVDGGKIDAGRHRSYRVMLAELQAAGRAESAPRRRSGRAPSEERRRRRERSH
jgi:ribosome biogenesis GTPase / thiamine phosphate phosphatase